MTKRQYTTRHFTRIDKTGQSQRVADSRRLPRKRYNKRARMLLKTGMIIRCVVTDLNSYGARIIIPTGTVVPAQFLLKIGLFTTPVTVKMIWQTRFEIGVEFVQKENSSNQ